MGQQVSDAEHRVVLVLTDADRHAGTVGTGEHAVDGQRHGAPLILAQTTIIVGLEVAEVVGLIQRVRAQVQPGAVDMGDHQAEALLKGFLADGGRNHGLVLLHKIDLLTGSIDLFRFKLLVTGFQQQLFAGGGRFAFGLGRVQKCLVALGKGGSFFLHVRVFIGGVLRLVQQLFSRLFCGEFLAHVFVSPLRFRHRCADNLRSRK